MMTKLKSKVFPLVEFELNEANKNYPPFHSPHEGAAVIAEEIGEAREALKAVDDGFGEMWQGITKDVELATHDAYIDAIEAAAVNLACEALQVAAMCEKYYDSLIEGEKDEKENRIHGAGVVRSLVEKVVRH